MANLPYKVSLTFLIGATFSASLCMAAEPNQKVEKLPEPLTLDVALSVASVQSHPDLLLAQANKLSAMADLERAKGAYQLNADLYASAAVIDPSDASLDRSTEDASLNLNINKQLYDFGYTASAIDSAESSILASELEQTYTRHARQIEIVRNYYDVILSDLKYLWENEDLAVRYIRFDKSRDRYELKQISDIELLEDEASYQKSLTKRRQTEYMQRTTRALLAESINRPGELSTKLDTKLRLKKDLELLDPISYIKTAMENNIELQAYQNKVTAKEHAIVSLENKWHPSLEAEVEVSEYSKTFPSKENWRAGLNLHVPLFESDVTESEIQKKSSELLSDNAKMQKMQSLVRNRIYTLWQSIHTLKTQERQLEVEDDHAQRSLDRRRGEYELELRTDFGVALVNTSRVRYQSYKNKVEQLLAWMELMILIGKEPITVIDQVGS